MMKLAELYTSSLPTPLPQKIQILSEHYSVKYHYTCGGRSELEIYFFPSVPGTFSPRSIPPRIPIISKSFLDIQWAKKIWGVRLMESLAVIFSSHALPRTQQWRMRPKQKIPAMNYFQEISHDVAIIIFYAERQGNFLLLWNIHKIMSSKEAYMHKKDQVLQADKLNKRPYALLRSSEGNNKKHYIFSGNGNIIHKRDVHVVR